MPQKIYTSGEFKKLLFELTALSSVSGMEQAVVKAMYLKLKGLADEIKIDAFGNIMATRFGKTDGPAVMIAAHSDEVGGLVRSIDKRGFLRFRLVGVVNPAILPSTRVLVKNTIPGTIGSVPGHLAKGEDLVRVKDVDELFIDVGASSDVEVRSWGISEGSSVTFASPMVEMQNENLVMGKSFDNRVGCAVLIKVFENMKDKPFAGTLYGVVNVQEEIGMRGAGMTASYLKPDYCIVLDTVATNDTPNSKDGMSTLSIGKGPIIQLWEGKAEVFLGTVAHPAVNKLILDSASKLKIPVQLSAEYGNWVTDGTAIHKTGTGIPTSIVTVGRRYSHSPNEICDIRDAAECIKLLTYIIEVANSNFDPRFITL